MAQRDADAVPYVRAETREDLLVVKEGALFVCARPDGDIRPGRASSLGLYARDTRHLSELTVALSGREPVLLDSADDDAFHAIVECTNADLHPGLPGRDVSQQTVSLRRELVISDGRLYVRLKLRCFTPEALSIALEVALGADFADMFDVRNVDEERERPPTKASAEGDALRFSYTGADERERTTLVTFDPAPAAVAPDGARATALWELTLEPRTDFDVVLAIAPDGSVTAAEPFDAALEHVRRSHREWHDSCTLIETDNPEFDEVIDASLRDLRALLTPLHGGEIVAAGVPWFVAPFGRDSLLTSYESLSIQPELARKTLLLLASLQATEDDPWLDSEPGKILHEIRSGEMAAAGLTPHSPYYGSADSTPLFVMLVAAYYRWTADRETIETLRPALDACLRWINEHGDADGDGLVEYERRSPGGLVNQGWKDSNDAVVHADGRLAEGPIALCEVQAYVYRAKLEAAELFEELGERDRAREIRAEAGALRDAFNDAFWVADEGTIALALDGKKRQVASVTSNAGHCLHCGIVGARRAGAVVERLMAEDMFGGWGVRTLANTNPAYNPMSYHCGSVWPHDNAIIASGFRRYGFRDAATQVASALFDVARGAPDSRLPELYCGFKRVSAAPVPYPVACVPQAWSAATPFLLLQTLLGLQADARSGSLTVHHPLLPDWLEEVQLSRLRIGNARVALRFRREQDITSFSLIESDGDVQVTMATA